MNITRADIEKDQMGRDADGNRVISKETAESIYQIIKSSRGEVAFHDLSDRFRSDNAVEIIARALAAPSESDAVTTLQKLGTKTLGFDGISDERCRRIIARYHRDNGTLLEYRDYKDKRAKPSIAQTQAPEGQLSNQLDLPIGANESGSNQSASVSNESPNEEQLQTASVELETEGHFDPASEADARKRVMREIVQRQGQPRFRVELIEAYGGRCAVTKCSVLRVLEAAHISPYRGEQTNTVTNGILLRSDIHTLFDLNLLGINPDDDFKVTFAESVLGGTYDKLNGTKLRLPKDDRLKPSQELLRIRWREFQANS